MPPPVSQRRRPAVSASALDSSRTSTVIAALFIVAALSSIALVIGGELYLQFHNASPSPSTFVIAGVYPGSDFSVRNLTYGPLNALRSCLHSSEMQCSQSSSNSLAFSSSSLSSSASSSSFEAAHTDVLTSLNDVMDSFASSGQFWCEASQELTLDEIKEKLLIDGSVLLVAKSSIGRTTSSVPVVPRGLFPSGNDQSPNESYVLIVGFNSSGVLTIDPTSSSSSGFYGFIRSAAITKNTSPSSSSIFIQRGGAITIGCPGFRPIKSIGSSWPKNMTT